MKNISDNSINGLYWCFIRRYFVCGLTIYIQKKKNAGLKTSVILFKSCSILTISQASPKLFQLNWLIFFGWFINPEVHSYCGIPDSKVNSGNLL
jgi:hypothetical protein